MRFGEGPEGRLVRDYLGLIQLTPLFIMLTIIVTNVIKVGKYCSTAESVKINNNKVVKRKSPKKVGYFTVRLTVTRIANAVHVTP